MAWFWGRPLWLLLLCLGFDSGQALIELPRGIRMGGHHPDLYSVLGVSSNADENEIRRAFRRRAMVHHPDRTGGSSSEFELLSFAADTLSDPHKRADYDLCGLAGVQQGGCQRVVVRGEESQDGLAAAHCVDCCSGAWGTELKAQCQRVRPCSDHAVCSNMAESLVREMGDDAGY